MEAMLHLPYGCLVSVKSTKTLKFKERILEIPLYFVQNPIFDVAAQLRWMFSFIPENPDQPIFLLPGNPALKCVSYSMMLYFLKKCVTLIDLPPSDFGLHSLRRSGVTYMYSLGVPIEDIRKMGDGQSLAVLLYIASPFDRKLAMERLVSQSFSPSS